MAAIAACIFLLGTAHARAGNIVADTVVSRAPQAQRDVPVTFGQVFKAGDVPRGAGLTASLNGQPVTLQVDAKATNPDGSLRHAVLTAMVPWIPGSAKLPLTIATGSSLPTHQDPVTIGQLLATNYDAAASFNIGGKTYTINARGLLQAADIADACVPWSRQCNVWLSGPLVSAWVVNGPVTAADGTTDPNVRVYFAVRAYAGATPGTVGYVRTDIIVENSNAFAPQDQPQYTATLTSGSATYTSPSLTQYSYTRWHQVLWWNNAQPKVYLQQDTQYIQASKAVSRYMDLQPGEAFLAGLRQSCAPLNHCDQTKTMGNTGAQAAIGPLPRWTSVYIVDPDIRAYHWMLANTDALGAYSIHYRDQATGWPVSIQRHPYATIIDWAYANSVAQYSSAKAAQYRADLLPRCCSISNPNLWDNAHQPAEGYVAYMVTGSYYYMEEVAFGASHNEIWSNADYRGYSRGLIDRSHSQVRGKAWVLREMADAAYLLPDGYPLKAEFNADVENSLADWNSNYTNNPDANPLHLMPSGPIYSMHGGTRNATAPWQHNFFTWSADHAAELGFARAAEFRNWLAKFEIGLMTDWQNNPNGYCWLEASAYNIQVKDAGGHWLPSYSAVYAASFPPLVGLACNSPAMVAKLGSLQNQSWRMGEMPGYPGSATGFPANFQIGIAAAADSGLPNAQTAWNLFNSRSVKPNGSMSYNNYPNFAVLPRPATDSAPVRQSEPPPSALPSSPPPPSALPSSPPPPSASPFPPPPPVATRNIALPAEVPLASAENPQPPVQPAFVSGQPSVETARSPAAVSQPPAEHPQVSVESHTENSPVSRANGWSSLRFDLRRVLPRFFGALKMVLPNFGLPGFRSIAPTAASRPSAQALASVPRPTVAKAVPYAEHRATPAPRGAMALLPQPVRVNSPRQIAPQLNRDCDASAMVHANCARR